MVQTTLGLNARRDMIAADITDMAIGDDDTVALITDVALGNQLDTQNIESVTNGATGIVTVRTRFPVGSAGTMVEVGSFEVGGDLQDHIIFAPVVKGAGVELLVDLTYTVS